MYPELNITNIVSENTKVAIGPWCSLNHNKGQKCKGHKHQVTPIKCLGELIKCSSFYDLAENCQIWYKVAGFANASL